MGPVRLTVTACASESPNCTAGNAPSLYRALVDADTDLTFAVSRWSRCVCRREPLRPRDSTRSPAGGALISFARSASYENALQQFEPAPAGERWWGWLGGQISYGRRTAQSFTFTASSVPLPRPADGGALPSPMRWRPVVGARSVDAANGLPATRAVTCGTTQDDFYEGFSEKGTLDLDDRLRRSAERGGDARLPRRPADRFRPHRLDRPDPRRRDDDGDLPRHPHRCRRPRDDLLARRGRRPAERDGHARPHDARA